MAWDRLLWHRTTGAVQPLGALATQFVFLFAFWGRLDEHDGAKAAGPMALAFDPLVLGVATPIALIGAVAAFWLSFLWERLEQPRRAAARTCQVTWCATAIGAYAFGKFGIPIAFAALFASAIACSFAMPRRATVSASRAAPAR